MDDVLGYKGKRVVVSGAASGMGAAATRLLIDFGAEVVALDIKPTEADVAQYLAVDLLDRESIEAAAAAAIDGGPVDAFLSCAGLPGAPFTELETATVNFVGARHLAELLVPSMPSGSAITAISSAGAIGWQQNLDVLTDFISTDGFDAGVAWLQEHTDLWTLGGYWISKQSLNAWVAWKCADLAPLGIRINCINPGPTDTPMMPQFRAIASDELLESMLGPIHRLSTPEEQAWPLVLLSSPRMSYVTGEVLWVDGGFQGAVVMGRKSRSFG